MGLFDIFKSTPTASAIANQVTKAKEAYAQSDYRRMAMDKLLKWDTNESLEGILERFCVVIQSPHWDEEEKSWLVQEFVKRGERVLPILRKFILTKNEVNHAILAFKQIVNDDNQYSELLLEALHKRPPSDHRTVQGKQEIISLLAELKIANLARIIEPYLHDHSDDVQCAAIGVLEKCDGPKDLTILLPIISSEVHSARVQRCAAGVIAKNKIPVGENYNLSDAVKEDYIINNGLLNAL